MILLLSQLALAQDARAVSIEEALARALETSEEVMSSEAGVRGAVGQRWSARSGFGPSAYGGLAYQHTFASEYDDFVPASGADPFELFAPENSLRADLRVTLPILSPSAFAQTSYAGASVDAAELALTQTKAKTTLSAAQTYFDAALADQLLTIGRSTLDQALTTFDQAKLAKDLGRQSEFELLRAQVEVENQRVSVVRMEQDREEAFLRLALALHLPEGESIELTSPLDAEAKPDIGTTARNVAGVPEGSTRAAITSAEKGVKMAQAYRWTVRSAALPTLSTNLDYGWLAYPETFWLTDPHPEDDLSVWHDFFYVGATLTVPLFGSGRAYGENLSAGSSLHQAEARLDLTRQAALVDAKNTQLTLEAAEAQWAATAGTVAVAQRAYDIASVRFNEGVSTQTELSDARILLEEAQANRARAARDLQLARIRFALLPALPFSGSP